MELISQLVSGYKPVVGVVHLPPLPGSPLAIDLDYAVDYAVEEARKLEEAGVDAVIVENYGDRPYPLDTAGRLSLASMAVVVREVVRSVSLPVGVNMLRNSAADALAAAYAAGASFIRVNGYCELRASPEGVMTPRARELEELRSLLPRRVAVLADVDVKHSYPLASGYDPAVSLAECVERGLPDAVVVTGPRTGEAPEPGYVAALAAARRSTPLLVGSGVGPHNVRLYWRLADGFIVATSLKRGGVTAGRYDVEKVRRFVELVRELRRKG